MTSKIQNNIEMISNKINRLLMVWCIVSVWDIIKVVMNAKKDQVVINSVQMHDDYKKITQLLNYFAHCNESKQISKLKALKLIWATDRYHLRHYGRLVSGDRYYAMALGPVASTADDIANNNNFLGKSVLDYALEYVTTSSDRNSVRAHKETDESLLSESDLEALTFAWETFGSHIRWDLSEITHKYPEWKRYDSAFKEKTAKREDINLLDFFENPSKEDVPNDPFAVDKNTLKESEEIFLESYA